MVQRVLVVEDDEPTANYIVKGLTEQGMVVDRAANGRDGLFLASDGSYDAIVLDRMLPQMDGMAVLGALRAADISTPVLILSALGSADERVAGLTAGSDDYLTKPFAFAELLARLKILMRRGATTPAVETRLTCDDLEMDLLSRKVKRAGKPIDLQPREFSLLEALMRGEGRVITRTMLLERVWDFHFDPKTSVVETHISRLRAKIDRPFEVPLIHTVRNTGYSVHAPS